MIDACDTALLLEGGGMRASYSAGTMDVLMEHGVRFGWVGGVSAGASHLVSYLSGERDRLRHSFVDFATDPHFGGWTWLLRGKGYFNAEYIYGQAPSLDLPRPYDARQVLDGDTEFRICATRADNGDPVYWGREDITSGAELMDRVRASSTIPFAMPVPRIDGVPYVDGALGPSGGIPLEAALADGYDQFFAVLTHPRGYVKPPMGKTKVWRTLLRRYPAVAEALVTRHIRYNATMDRLYALERAGRAFLHFPEDEAPVSSTERKVDVLRDSLHRGTEQARRDWSAMDDFLGRPAVPTA
ncbi:patatin family protein [Corynebacterium glyciniphilum]|uniref:patatin-like phospholipase family protein n=1 Tax=Corynebacterium glyciniphilum TaxID=1404244 RepID=UPI002655A453|nr:patatin family protein [Corynebacterium glyciniphilum]MDN5684984.1 patatin family protein [Corynebacterium glyciniphilum]